MRLTLTREQTESAIRAYLSDPDESADVSVRVNANVPIRVTSGRGGNMIIYTGEDATRPKPVAKVKSKKAVVEK